MTKEERIKLRDAALAAIDGVRNHDERKREASKTRWELQTSNSFRRIGTHGCGDGDVLHAMTQRSDGHPDLVGAPGVLAYIIAAQPNVLLALLDGFEELEAELERVRASNGQ